ncbi:MAG: Asp-tRNA(Asn)/Glu-tRNA(Gln) amidotransferase subunit GatB [Bacillota bacterium]|nr:Asp-tRNA(Asn)/Glu-tRNA(Gln) amidotransferase subunit GatB [Bacillota bacterium]
MHYETIIGLEIHLELQTSSKLFCGCSTSFGQEANTNCCPVCLGLPGTLPVFNKRAIELAVTAALALNSDIQLQSRFDRKNYYYPDLPKAYQISQYEQPLAKGGYLEVEFESGLRRINLERVHLEEEAGKLIHAGDSIFGADYSLVDYNRTGIPLLEIVTAPDIRSGSEARKFLETLRSILLYSGASDCKMEEGSLRCDANISLRPVGSQGYGVKAEVKNMNSFRAVETALYYEAKRQEKILAGGGTVIQQTCHWDEAEKITIPIRSKEGSSDYRYFPEPDLLPLTLDKDFISRIAESLPEMPGKRRARMAEHYGLGESELDIFIENRPLADFFEAAAEKYDDYKNLANWVQGDFLYQLRENDKKPEEIKPELFVELLTLLEKGQINRPVAKELLAEMIQNGSSPKELVEEKGLGRIAGGEKLIPLIEQVIAENPDAVENYRQGKEKAITFLVGRVMALTKGRADPGELNKLLREKISQQ